ncbi:MAG: tRNA pseudouridine(38-40) synthase TruA, partial [Fulvivirga sp.]
GKTHPFGAPFLTFLQETLNIDLMKSIAPNFIGEHNFKSFCVNSGEQSQVIRTVSECSIIENTQYKGSFMPDESFILIVKGPGFGRHQVRMMMAFLFEVGRGNLNNEQLKKALSTGNAEFSMGPAPASGLILHKVDFTK